MTGPKNGRVLIGAIKTAGAVCASLSAIAIFLLGIYQFVTKPIVDKMDRMERSMARIEGIAVRTERRTDRLEDGQRIMGAALKLPLWSEGRQQGLDSLANLDGRQE